MKMILGERGRPGIFGRVKAHVAVVEFQKRGESFVSNKFVTLYIPMLKVQIVTGAPHTHVLLWLEDFDMTPANIDRCICAEIPYDPRQDPSVTDPLTPEQKAQADFYDLVVEKMIHGPCGPLYNRSHLGCCKSGKCKRNFPRPFRTSTIINDDRYPDYRRRTPAEGGNTCKIWYKNVEYVIDNGWVVPYNPRLLCTFRCHINVEYVHSIKTLKYLLGYHFKGEDLVSVAGIAEDDEISLYSTRRYISACMAIWRFFEFDTIRMKPSVRQLGIHLEGQQLCRYEANEVDAQDSLQRHHNTMLMDYFNANQCPIRGDVARQLKYEDMPTKFVWNQDDKVWQLRKINIEQLGRIVNIHPRSHEEFHLRLLLKHVKGKTIINQNI